MEVDIITKENIKPATPTPDHLRTYKVSFLDQLGPHAYVPIIFFYPNNQSTVLNDVISERRHRLKQSLSELLTRFYPLAGKVIDDLQIECNDDGMFYVEARVSSQLPDFLRQPDYKSIHQLLPYEPGSEDLLSKTYVAMVQVNIFSCGGIAIALYASHKLVDGYSGMTFWKAWAAAARGSSDQICPSFISPQVFPPNPSLLNDASEVPTIFEKCKYVARRFVFDASSLAALKAKVVASTSVKNPSRVMAVMGLIWKCAMVAARKRLGFQKPSIMLVPVDLRTKCSPAFPHYSFGNIIWSAVAQCTHNTDMELSSIVGCLHDAIREIDNNFVEELKGEEGSDKMGESLKKLKAISSNKDAEYLVATSLCNAGLYDIDFGWEKPTWICPTWICHGGADAGDSGLPNLIFLMDTKSGDGIEALVSLNEHVMSILEHDPDLLTFASVNPSPLESSTLLSHAHI